MITVVELRKLGYSRQVDSLLDMLYKNNEDKIHQTALNFARMGCTVNYSFYEKHKTDSFTKDEVIKAIHDLNKDAQKRMVTDRDIYFPSMRGKKWYQFWKDDFSVKLINCLKLI